MQSYEPICGSGVDDTIREEFIRDESIRDESIREESIVMSMLFQMWFVIAVDVMSRARCGENLVDSVGSMFIGNGNNSACGYSCFDVKWIPCLVCTATIGAAATQTERILAWRSNERKKKHN